LLCLPATSSRRLFLAASLPCSEQHCVVRFRYAIDRAMALRRGQRRAVPSRATALRRSAGAKPSLHILLIALGLLLAQVPSLLHLLLVPHTTCEHGELVEIAEAAELADSAGHDPIAVPDRRSEGAQIAVSHASGSGHDHCDALAVRHQIPEVGVSVAAASLLSIELAPARGERGETRPVPLLSLAPKSSPPAA
jgi:hypothetical protein